MNWEAIKKVLADGGIRLLSAIVIVIIGLFLVNFITNILEKRLEKRKHDPTIARFLITFSRFLLTILVVVLALTKLGSNTAFFTTVFGAAALSLGLALQGSLSNLAGGILLVLFRPFRIGDFIRVDELSGTVEDIGILYTALRTVENNKVIIPNGKLSNDQLVNTTAYETKRVDIPFLIDSKEEVASVRKILLEYIADDSRVLLTPKPTVLVVQKNDYAAHLELRVWAPTVEVYPLYWELLEGVPAILREKEIKLASPSLMIPT